MANSFNLHNRAELSSVDVDVTTLESSARDRKNQLENMIFQLKKIALHLHAVTDEEIREEDVEE